MDALTEILRSLRLTGAVFLEAEFTAPWCVTAQVGPEDCNAFMPMPAAVIAYHYVLEGELLLQLEGEPSVPVRSGQLLIFPRNDSHLLGSHTGIEPVSADDLIEPAGADGRARIRFGGGGPVTRLFCGFLGSDAASNPLLASLPPVISLDLAGDRKRPWIEGSIHYAVEELTRADPAAWHSLTRLAELLFGEAVRDYLGGLPHGETGWLPGLRDRHVGQALALMHGRPGHEWTLEELAQEVGLSRSAFADRFARHIGQSPMRYLIHHRLHDAANRLSTGGETIAQIAFAAGYESEAAFSRAFKRVHGRSPAAFREASRAPAVG